MVLIITIHNKSGTRIHIYLFIFMRNRKRASVMHFYGCTYSNFNYDNSQLPTVAVSHFNMFDCVVYSIYIHRLLQFVYISNLVLALAFHLNVTNLFNESINLCYETIENILKIIRFSMDLQYVTEKMGGAEGTKLDLDFMDMERVSKIIEFQNAII